jgi:hypothetical protein
MEPRKLKNIAATTPTNNSVTASFALLKLTALPPIRARLRKTRNRPANFVDWTIIATDTAERTTHFVEEPRKTAITAMGINTPSIPISSACLIDGQRVFDIAVKPTRQAALTLIVIYEKSRLSLYM